MKGICKFGGGTGVVLATCSVALATELPPNFPAKAPAAYVTNAPRLDIYDWSGFYVGGHFGYGDASLGPGTNPLPLQGIFLPHSPTGLIGGFQMGYNRQLANHLVLGVEADASFTSPTDAPALTQAPFNTALDYVGTLRGRVGYAFGKWMPYATGGFAWGHTHVNINEDPQNTSNIISSVGHYQTGWTAGLGLEFAVSGNWSAKLEY